MAPREDGRGWRRRPGPEPTVVAGKAGGVGESKTDLTNESCVEQTRALESACFFSRMIWHL
jgi:hypothetical protein